MPNQYKPLPPTEQIEEYLQFYYNLRLTDGEIAKHMEKHYNTELYGLGVYSVKKLRKQLGLLSTRQQKHTLESIRQQVLEIRERFPQRGIENIRKSLHTDYGLFVPRTLVAEFLHLEEPEAVKQRKHRHLVRKRYWSAGVNDTWSQDQHDKWGRFGLWLHCCVDVFSGQIIWLKIWWNNRNPRVVCQWYLEAVRKLGAIPLVTQSDPGTENFGVANAHTIMRHHMDPSLSETMQHRWMQDKQNIKAEIIWSLLRRDWTPGFENILDEGVNNGWYKAADPLENLLFRWLAIPWLQRELDRWIILRNFTKPRADKNKILPHGAPELIYSSPEVFDSYDFKILVPSTLIDQVQETYAPPDHEVQKLVPELFSTRVAEIYSKIGEPFVSSKTFWDVYREMLYEFRRSSEASNNSSGSSIANLLESFNAAQHITPPDPENPLPDHIIPLLPGLRELRGGDSIVGDILLPADLVYIGGLETPPIPPSVLALAQRSKSSRKRSRLTSDSQSTTSLRADFTQSNSDIDPNSDLAFDV